MDTNFANAWIHALRSGKYEQGFDALRCGDRYCCLGVLLELWIFHNESSAVSKAYWNMHGIYRGETKILPRYVMEKLGMTNTKIKDIRIGTYYSSDEKLPIDHLADANDYSVDFSYIADWIEQNHTII